MTEVEKVARIYRKLPPEVQREALDFLLFLEQPRGQTEDGLTGGALDVLTEVGFIGRSEWRSTLSCQCISRTHP